MFKANSVNVRGLCEDEKQNWIREIWVKERPIMIGIQESKCNRVDDVLITGIWGQMIVGMLKLMQLGNLVGLFLYGIPMCFRFNKYLGI